MKINFLVLPFSEKSYEIREKMRERERETLILQFNFNKNMYVNKTLKKIYQVILFSNKTDVKYVTNINKKN